MPDDVLTVGVQLTVFGEQCSRELPVDKPEPSLVVASPPAAGTLGTIVFDIYSVLSTCIFSLRHE